jgi:hypothetical protein
MFDVDLYGLNAVEDEPLLCPWFELCSPSAHLGPRRFDEGFEATTSFVEPPTVNGFVAADDFDGLHDGSGLARR